MTSRTSARPACTADSSSNAASACWAARRASVVFPAPGGPYRTMLCGWPASSDWRSAEPGAEQVLLADELVERLRPHPRRERPVGRRPLVRALLRWVKETVH